ncbi:MAG: peptidoglycan DD-metalloendopeptidase family protein [Natronospirillum sp.]
MTYFRPTHDKVSKKSSNNVFGRMLIRTLALIFLLSAYGCVNNAGFIALEDLPSRPASQTASGAQPSRAAPSANASRPATTPNRSAITAETRPSTYRVQAGDTLYSISFRYNLDFRRVAAANNISAPYTIVPGQVIRLTESGVPATATAPSVSTPAPSTGAPPRQTSASPTPSTPAASMPVTNWRWPVEGNIVRTFSSSPSGSKGIDISAPIGESVVAAADGRVVYAGDGLRGYGNLIILEHAGRVLSAYAFASAIKVSEQQQVKQGDVIAEVGARGDEPLLHFEIRQDGRPVDPLSYLPRR